MVILRCYFYLFTFWFFEVRFLCLTALAVLLTMLDQVGVELIEICLLSALIKGVCPHGMTLFIFMCMYVLSAFVSVHHVYAEARRRRISDPIKLEL